MAQQAWEKNRISMKWADKFAVGLLAITGIVAAISAFTLSVYPTTSERVGVALGLFVGVAAVFVLPLWFLKSDEFSSVFLTSWPSGDGRQPTSL